MDRVNEDSLSMTELVITNEHLNFALRKESDERWQMALSLANNSDSEKFFHSGPLLALTETERRPLSFSHVERVIGEDGSVVLSLRGKNNAYEYGISFGLVSNRACVTAKVSFTTSEPSRGWFHAGCQCRPDVKCWIYPWLNGGRNVTPTLGGHKIHMDVPGHIHAELAGVPMIIVQPPNGTIGGIGYPLAFDYRHASLGFEQHDTQVHLGVGLGKNEGISAFHGKVQYYPGVVYAFEYQLFALKGSFRDLACEWSRVNELEFDRKKYYGFSDALQMAIRGREAVQYAGVERYISKDVCGIPVHGYRHSSQQSRISVYRQSLNAYIDYLLFQYSGKKVFKKRSIEQMEFLLASQTEDGWYYEDWQLLENNYSYEVIGQDGGVTQVLHHSGATLARPNDGLIWGTDTPDGKKEIDIVTGRNIRGPRPDYLGLTILYIHKLITSGGFSETLCTKWNDSLDRCLDWILAIQRRDGSFSMTVAPDRSIHSETAPCSRLLVALDRIATDRRVDRIDNARAKHEDWIIDNCVSHGRWWGSHKDTGLTIDYGGLQTFIQYCVQRFSTTGDNQYLSFASECTYFNFFQHCPKQLEWLWHYSKGGIQEQSNYLQPDIDTMDNLILSSWYRLAKLRQDDFLVSFVDQQVYTMMHTLCDDVEDPWYGCWAQYLVDYANAVERYDQNPVTENKTKYSGSITPSIIEDILLLIDDGYTIPE